MIAEPEWTGGTADRAAWSVRGMQETVTDQGGAFRFAGLPDGTYRVRAARPGAAEAALSLAPGVVDETERGADQGRRARRTAARSARSQLADGKPAAAFTLALGRHERRRRSRRKDGAFALPAAAGTLPAHDQRARVSSS